MSADHEAKWPDLIVAAIHCLEVTVWNSVGCRGIASSLQPSQSNRRLLTKRLTPTHSRLQHTRRMPLTNHKSFNGLISQWTNGLTDPSINHKSFVEQPNNIKYSWKYKSDVTPLKCITECKAGQNRGNGEFGFWLQKTLSIQIHNNLSCLIERQTHKQTDT